MTEPGPAASGVGHDAGVVNLDAIIIGAGITGLAQLYFLRKAGLFTRLFEMGSGVGGVWYWNRFPGARFDSESYSYGYSFSSELLEEWNWSEHFAGQPETLRYLNHVADRFGLRGDIQCDSRVTAAHWDETSLTWLVTLEGGRRYRSRFVFAAVGPLSIPVYPRIEGRESFAGESHHTARWPHEPVGFEGKRVGVIGTASTGVQTIQEVAKTAKHLTVFQRTANYCIPLNNRPIDEATQRRIKAGYPEMFARTRTTSGWFVHSPSAQSVFDVTPEEREAHFEALYASPGMGFWQGNYRDVLSEPKANDLASEFVKKKIRQRVKDPAVAEKLVPWNHGFGTRRVAMETKYYEVYNQPNVTLVDLRATPIERITPRGVKTSDAEHELDMLIYATGFDAVIGSFNNIDIRGRGGEKLRDRWSDGPTSFIGKMVAGFPNFFMPAGALAALGNIPRCSEYDAEWLSRLMRHMKERGLTVAEARPEAEQEWTAHARDVAKNLLSAQVSSWTTGVNTNLEGRQNRFIALYRGGAPAYIARCEQVAAEGYKGMVLV